MKYWRAMLILAILIPTAWHAGKEGFFSLFTRKPKQRRCKDCKPNNTSDCYECGTFNEDGDLEWKFYPQNCKYYKRKRLRWWAAK